MQISGWSTPVNLGPVINSEYNEDLPHISRDGLSLYFISNRPPRSSPSDFNIFVSHRPTPNDPWGAPVRLGSIINTDANERGPCLTADGHYLLFSSNREDLPDRHGSQDLWVSYREDTYYDDAWQTPVNLGSNVNTTGPDYGAALLEEGEQVSALLFGRPGAGGRADIYMSMSFHINNKYGPFGGLGFLRQAVLVPELSDSRFDDLRPTIRADGLELFFNSNRALSSDDDSAQSNDIWVSTRHIQSDPWSTPINLGPIINTGFEEQYPAVSAEGSTLIFSSNRTGSLGSGTSDLWMSRRNVADIPRYQE